MSGLPVLPRISRWQVIPVRLSSPSSEPFVRLWCLSLSQTTPTSNRLSETPQQAFARIVAGVWMLNVQ